MIGVSIANSLGFTGASVLPDASAQAYFAATGITNVTQQQAIDTLIKGLKSDGIWSKMKAIYPFVTDNRNLFGYTEDFSNAFWFKDGVTITSNSITAPNGTLTADSLIENTANSQHYVGVTSGLTLTAAPYTISAYFKKANRDWASLGLYNGTDSKNAWFNLNTGTIGTINAGVTATITDVGNGWYHCSVTRTMAAVSNNFVGILPAISDGVSTYIGNGLVGVYTWGAQLELGSNATTYQPIATTQQAFIANQFKYNLKDPRDLDAAYRLVFNGGWTHSTLGATPNGTNGFADTKLNQTVAGMFGNSHLSYYSRTNNTTATQQIEMGAGANVLGTFSNLLLRLDTTTNYIGGSVGSRSPVSTSADSLGHVIVNALSASAKSFKNGSLIATDTSTQTGVLNTFPIYLGCQNNNGTASQYSTRQTAFASIGDGLTDTEAANLYTRVQAFQTALNRQV